MSKCFGETSKNKIFALLCIFICLLFASCGGGGGGGGGGGAVSYAPDSNTPHNGGDAGGWGTGTQTGGGMGGSTIEEQNATLLLGQSAALSYQKVDIDLIVNGEHFAINNVTATTTTEVLPKIPIGASVSGTATIYLADGNTRIAQLEMTEIGLHNNLVFKVPYNYSGTVNGVTFSGTYFSRDGIDLSSYTVNPVVGWTCLETGSVHAGGYITGVRGDITLEPRFDTGTTYNVSYVTPVQSVPDGYGSYTPSTSLTLPVLSDPNLRFEGWFEDPSFGGSPVSAINIGTTGDKTYYAKWVADVTFVKNYSGGGTFRNDTVIYNSLVSSPDTSTMTRTDYNFVEWCTSPDGGTTLNTFDFTNTRITRHTTLYANWNLISYNVHYHVPSGFASVADSTYTVEGGTLTTPPARTDLDFVNWYTDETYNTLASITNTTGDKDFYGKWKANVTFAMNDGSGDNFRIVPITYRGYASSPSPNPTRTGYDFVNWCTTATGGTAFNFGSSQIIQHITIYANWQIQSYTVSFDTDGGSSVSSQTITYGGHVAQPSTNPTKNGNRFGGWYKDSACTIAFDFANDTITEPTTIYAKWLDKLDCFDLITLSDVQAKESSMSTGTIASNYVSLVGKLIYFKTSNGAYGAMIISGSGSDTIQFHWRNDLSSAYHYTESNFHENWGFDLDGGFTDDDNKDFGIDDSNPHTFKAHNGAKFYVFNSDSWITD